MLLHLRPRLYYSRFRNVQLLDVKLDGLGLHLRGGVDLMTGRPYPNKDYLVACRREGRKAINGIFIETRQHVEGFECVTRWAVEGMRVLTHRVTYRALDKKHDAMSDDSVLWLGCDKEFGDWPSRVPASGRQESHMEAVPLDGPGEGDRLDREGWIVERWAQIAVPTIERGRFNSKLAELSPRLPQLASAFQLD